MAHPRRSIASWGIPLAVSAALVATGGPSARAGGVDQRTASPQEAPNGRSAHPLEGRALDNLVAFTRLLGYVRYFHPSDEAAWADWEEVAIAGVRAVEPARSADELAGLLEDVFRPLGPTIRVFPSSTTPALPAEVAAPPAAAGLKVTAWRHRGCDLGNPRSNYRSERIQYDPPPGARETAEHPHPARPFTAELGGGVSCMVPLAVYVDADGTTPAAVSPAGGHASDSPGRHAEDDRAARLAAVVLCWNVMQHFYPYFDVVDADWPAALRQALASAATAVDDQAMHATLRRLMAELHDGHGFVSHRSDERRWMPALLWDWIEGRLVVTQVDDEDLDLRPGDVVVSIDGQPAEQALVEVEKLISAATPQWRRYRGLQRLAAGRRGDTMRLEVRGTDREPRTVTVTRTTGVGKITPHRPPKIHELEPGIFYVGIDRVSDADFTAALPRLEEARGIVFDFRGYPRHIRPGAWFPHIIRESVRSPQWHKPIVTRPDRANWWYERGGEWDIAPADPLLSAPKVFLIDGRAISYAESCLGIVEHYKLGALVGEPTAGTNGNVNPFTLPGGYRVVWTGMRVLKQDGSRHHGVGILPTVPVSRTIDGVAQGRDELLERAVELLKTAPRSGPAPPAP